MRKRFFIWWVAVLLLMAGCSNAAAEQGDLPGQAESAAMMQTPEPTLPPIPEPTPTPTPEPTPTPTPEPEEITLVMVGDILLHTPVEEAARQEDGSYQFDAVFANVKEEIEEADLAIVNQEVIIGGEELGIS